MKKVIRSNKAPAPIGPYSQAIEVNGMLFVSGNIAMDADTGELVNDNITNETKKVMQNLEQVLKAADMNFSNIVKTSIFLDEMSDFNAVNEVYATYFEGSAPPARETVAVKGLPKNVNVEISVIAVR